jgi:stage II sporulation protein M
VKLYRKDLEYAYSIRKYIIAVCWVFILSIIIGLIVSFNNPGLSENYLESFKTSFGWIKSLDPIAIMAVIFLNNALKSLMAIVLGVGFGIIPILFIAGNGVVLSILADIVSKEHSAIFVIAAILPHGIIEVPMVIISASIGLRLGHVVFLSLKGMKTDIGSELRNGVVFYMRIILPLLFVAAMVETFVTPLIAFRFMT